MSIGALEKMLSQSEAAYIALCCATDSPFPSKPMRMLRPLASVHTAASLFQLGTGVVITLSLGMHE